MKYAIGLLIAILTTAPQLSLAGEKVFVMSQLAYFANDTVNLSEMSYILFVDRKCELPIIHAKDMNGGIVRYGNGPHKLCWGVTLSQEVIVVDDMGNTQNQGPLYVYMAGELLGDGSVKIVRSMHNKKDYEPCSKNNDGRWCRKIR